jgi:Fe-Mn family superoxide dismutase
MWNTTPLLCCDVWEHAYYLQYQNNRGRWVDNFMRIANWSVAAVRLAQARGNSGMSAVRPRMMSYY